MTVCYGPGLLDKIDSVGVTDTGVDTLSSTCHLLLPGQFVWVSPLALSVTLPLSVTAAPPGVIRN